MFFVYKSNHINTLLSKAIQIMQAKPLPNIFEKEIFVHDNKILFKYINIFLAQKIGISANLKLYHPHDFIWTLFEKILFKKKIKSIFTNSVIMWNIVKFLDQNNFFIKFNHKNTINKFKFSFLMANIFKQYIFYRPHWINAWEIGKNISNLEHNKIWQIKLWMEIVNNIKKNNQSINHFANMFKSFNILFKEKKINKNNFPHRFFIISSFALNPSYLEIFKKISSYSNIYFLHITPYKYNIFNTIQNTKSILNNKAQKNNINNSLIKLWGKYEKIYEYYIIESKQTKITNYFKKYTNSNLLNNIKNNFLKKKDCNQNTKKLLKATDHSISIHICYNKKNEIEILYETLLVLLDKNPSISPGDIIVTSTSIDTYTSYIHSIFTAINKKKQIPFCIVKNFNKKINIIILSFKKIFNLSNSRFENKEILELLDIPEIASKFDISDEEIKILYHWIEETNIRWAIDEQHKDDLLFPKHKQNTWLYGIEKLLLSYSMNNTNNIWNHIVSSSVINNFRAELISKLIIFINTLKKWQKKLSKSRNIQYWSLLANDIIKDFFSYHKNIEKYFEIIKKKWIKTIDDSKLAYYSNKISINILKILFFNQFNHNKNQNILPGAINFCSASSICYIPFKIICIIGSDHQSIPEKNQLDNFNLLKTYSSIGDLNSYEKSCYLFFQSLSCATKYFYISYVGYSIKDESKICSSHIVNQLLNYISLNFYLSKNDHVNIHDNTKNIIKHICKTHHKKYFYTIKTIDHHVRKELQYTYKNIEKKIDIKDQFNKNTINQVYLQNIINFWKNPIRYFFKYNLNIQFNTKQNIIKTTEPFSVNQLDAFKIKSILLKKIIYNENIDELFQYYVASGKLPYGVFGKIFWDKSIEEMQSIAKFVVTFRNNTQEQNINLKIKKYRINGILSEIQDTGLLRWKPNTINYSDRISLWLEHLIYCISGGIGNSKIIGYKKQIWSFCALEPDIAYYYLLKYIKGYFKGIKKIILLTKSGVSWLDAVYDIKHHIIKKDNLTKQKGNLKLLQTWIGNNFSQGEKNDFYIQKTFVELNEYNIKEICKIAQTWFTPILKYKK
ncbi:exodeoxyribonuclease V subunit gamma [Buchnera aphidicola]|uniref:RecBCD enzyme subunit RecC n=1 Tax=Buchnera aphidicola str. Ua (Uroleucon ambrosiae) TaxID=1005057 RepID=G2LPU4_BUCUM|nr:exodeoxyribonuclease V subunit gamma [Buchnera aphidicola]AEO08231.1 exodeoxyribonuclease V 125 kDa polypeptide [Buchnera aphidicola str. Ua (Uroleucon ambrosiae)]